MGKGKKRKLNSSLIGKEVKMKMRNLLPYMANPPNNETVNSYMTVRVSPTPEDDFSHSYVHNPYGGKPARSFGALVLPKLVDGAAGRAVPRGYSGLGGLGDLATLYSTYKPWIWIAGAVVGLIWAKKKGYLEE